MNQEKRTLRSIGQSIQHRTMLKRHGCLVDETLKEVREKLENLRNCHKK